MSSIFADQYSALVIRVQMRGEGGSWGVSANEYSCAPGAQILWRPTSIFNLWATFCLGSVRELTDVLFNCLKNDSVPDDKIACEPASPSGVRQGPDEDSTTRGGSSEHRPSQEAPAGGNAPVQERFPQPPQQLPASADRSGDRRRRDRTSEYRYQGQPAW
jgi:hypothetical protein